MKTSEIAHYWMAKAMVDITGTSTGCSITSPMPCPRFTLRLSGARPGKWSVNGKPLREGAKPLSLEPGTWARDGDDVVVAVDLKEGETRVGVG
jgi:hypothetical protein